MNAYPRRAKRINAVWRFSISKALILIILLALLGGTPGVALAGTPLYPSDNERLGFGVTRGIENYNVAPLQAGWYVNWGTTPQAAHPAGLEFAQIIRTDNTGYAPSGDNLTAIIGQNPGSLWLIGNEPDCPYQDNVLPVNYARVYHAAYQAIKAQDPTAQIAIGGIVQATPLRMQWLDLVWSEYLARYGQTMPVDVWNVHAFVLREVRPGHGAECKPPDATEGGEWGAGIPPGISANCGAWVDMDGLDQMEPFQEQIVRFRTWMRAHGQQNKPLIVSEYGILFNAELGYGYERVRDYMLDTFDYFLSARDQSLGYPADDYHLVQRWAWYSLDDDSFVWGTTYSALMDPDTRELYQLGYDFAHYASVRMTPYVDLQPAGLRVNTPQSIPYGQIGVVKLKLDVRNQGNTTSPASQVRFWDGNPDQGGVLLGTVSLSAVPSRYAGRATATLDWSVAAFGKHVITMQIDATGQVQESREDNNRLAVTVDFGSLNLAVGAAGWELVRGPLRAGEASQISLGPAQVAVDQPSSPSPGLKIVPPAYRATWYDDDPAEGGHIIASRTMPAPATFGASQSVPAQTWSPVINSPRSPRLVVELASSAPETSLSDNQVTLAIPATTDLVLVQAQQVGGVPLGEPGIPLDVPLRFQMANLGPLAPSDTVHVSFWPGTEISGTGTEFARVKLAPTGDWTASLIWPGLELGAHPFVAVVDPDNVIAETDETNNQLAGVALVAKTRYYLPWAGR